MDFTDLNNPLVRSLYEDNFVRSEIISIENDAMKTKITFGIDEN
jgi:hypothetical protein